jgi:ribosomal protein S4
VTCPAWLSADPSTYQITVQSEPERSMIDAPCQEQMIVELYSK